MRGIKIERGREGWGNDLRSDSKSESPHLWHGTAWHASQLTTVYPQYTQNVFCRPSISILFPAICQLLRLEQYGFFRFRNRPKNIMGLKWVTKDSLFHIYTHWFPGIFFSRASLGDAWNVSFLILKNNVTMRSISSKRWLFCTLVHKWWIKSENKKKPRRRNHTIKSKCVIQLISTHLSQITVLYGTQWQQVEMHIYALSAWPLRQNLYTQEFGLASKSLLTTEFEFPFPVMVLQWVSHPMTPKHICLWLSLWWRMPA